ncbi:heat-inducible transcriptional repressor HrcA [Woeseia oceani]|uniref:Heat-inducible transcription repressor HrcA n=1 Tax=Woeseia oceani TaxID=1548547 RepID=A0A193LGE0_9GAMM|nr:heat-inducible transcriptional repressor HrcA [Woeseia oceani]ANO51528.1 heat-inducible transcriptional repressor HrcA [Woeseia oceani]
MSKQAVSNVPNERSQYLLKILIQRFIRDGQPVGSRTLSRDSGLDLSPATIRNVLADLEDLGFVSAPHTSAGRVPTPRGYRMFVDTLVQYKQPKDGEIRRLQKRLAGNDQDPDNLVSSVSNALSRITSLAGVVTMPKGQHATLRQIEFLPLSDNRVLAILVINNREVQNRILNTDRNYTSDELQRAANYINENYAGVELKDIHLRLVSDLEKTRDSMNQAMLDIVSVAQSAMDGAGPQKSGFVVSGETNLMGIAELSDIDKLRRLFDAFSHKRLLIDLLDRSISANGVQVFIGEESGYQILDDCSVVSAPYRMDDGKIGVLGVIGPTRMAYDRVVPIVEVTAKMLGSVLNVPD